MKEHPMHYQYPMRFPKINTLFMRDMIKTVKGKGVIMPGKYSEETFNTIKFWKVKEKVDGENIRIFIDFIPGNTAPPHIWVGGRNDTDTPQINEDLLSYIRAKIDIESIRRAFTRGSFGTDDCPRYAMIFGEAYGGDIKHGRSYINHPKFILFDIVIDGWWLEYNNVNSIAAKLGVKAVPALDSLMSIEEIIDYVKSEPLSKVSNQSRTIEGVVCDSAPLLMTRKGDPLRFKLKVQDFKDLKIIGEITLEDIKNMETHEFQKWVSKCLSVTSQSNGTIFDEVIDFPSFEQFNGALIRMEQYVSVGEPIIKAIREKMIVAEKDTAFIIAPSFTERAIELVSELKMHEKVNIHLVTLESIVNKTTEEIFKMVDLDNA